MTGPVAVAGDVGGPGPVASRLPDLPDEAYVAALAGLPHLTPARLRRLLCGRSPGDAWALVRAGAVLSPPGGQAERRTPAAAGTGGSEDDSGWWQDLEAGDGGGCGEPASRGGSGRSAWTPERLARAWAAHALSSDPGETWAGYAALGIAVHVRGSPAYPALLAADPQAPAALFSVGSLDALGRPRAAVIGTRASTHYGEEVATELGLGLAGAGVSVVSGLALGIDGAAHAGALAGGGAPPLGVVGSGLDVVYPKSHARLWARVAAAGGLVSEAPLGAAPEAWRFPWRNRLLAALADVVVVVESHRAGGSLLTVEAAVGRGVPVLAVPGSVRSAASAGTNALLADGCPPARDVDDVLVALGLRSAGAGDLPGGRSSGAGPSGPAGPAGQDRAVWLAVDGEPTPTETVLRRTGLPLGEAAAALGRLEEAGWARAGDGWWERLEGSR
ncbi:MAG: DNA-processing protein DprA [Acidimicrobiales bacterium]